MLKIKYAHIRDPNGAKLSKWSFEMTIQPILDLLDRITSWLLRNSLLVSDVLRSSRIYSANDVHAGDINA